MAEIGRPDEGVPAMALLPLCFLASAGSADAAAVDGDNPGRLPAPDAADRGMATWLGLERVPLEGLPMVVSVG